MIDDAELLRRYAEERSDAAFAEFVRRHIDVVYGAAFRRTGDPHAAADVAQQVFIAAARNAPALARHASMNAWLYTATRNAALNFLRGEQRRWRRERAAHAAQEALAGRGADEETVSPEQLRPVLDAAMDDLDDRDREAVLLRFFAGLPLAEVGARLRLSENAARMRVERALEKLRARLARRGVTSTSAALGLVLAQQAALAAPFGLADSVASGAVAGAAAAGGASVGTGALAFMSTTKFTAAVGALGVLLALGTATLQWRHADAANQALAAARRARDAQLARLREAETRADAAQDEATRAQSASAAAPAAPPAPWHPAAEGRAFLERHPEVKAALADYVGASVRFRFAPLIRELGLTPAQVEQLAAIQGQGTGMGASLGQGRDVTLMFGERPGADWSQRIAAVIGEEAAQRWIQFSGVTRARHVTADVASALYFTETPLTPDQAARLVTILRDSRQPRGAARTGEFDWNATIAKAGPVLAAPQLAVLAGLRANDEFHQVLNRPRAAETPKGN